MIFGAILLAIVFLIWTWLVIGVLHEGDRFRLRSPPPEAGKGPKPPRISVIVPARNEAHQIAVCIASLRGQTILPREVIVVDDCSTDGTGAVLRGLPEDGVPVTVVDGAAPPAGWLGKAHALHQGAARATGEWLLFTDADTIHAPETLAAALAHAGGSNAALVSLTGDQRAESSWERIVQPLVFRLLDALYPLAGANGPDAGRVAANGIYMLIRRDAYDDIGGHEAFRGAVLEDVAMARALRERGHPTAFLRGDELLQVRMYREFREIWEGWTKNLWFLLGENAARARMVAALVLLAGFLPGAMLWYGGATGGLAAITAVGAEAWFRRGRKPLWALTLPLGALLLAAMIGESARRHLEGREFSWKGRTYPS
ncbi:MAG: glycosyltransferase family A protein [Deltaproteobacteria bacterium]|nr:glycosyltransferase family A protein [Deltaproteobacteria bacterium]